MITICESCGKKYRIDLEKMPGSSAKFNCTQCSSLISIQKPAEEGPPEVLADADMDTGFDLDGETDFGDHVDISEEIGDAALSEEIDMTKPKLAGMSIRTKITLIIVFLVLVSLSLVGFFASFQSRKALADQAEGHLKRIITQKSVEYSLVFERLNQEILGFADFTTKTFQRNDITTDLGFRLLMPWTGSGYGSPEISASHPDEILKMQRVGIMLNSLVPDNPYLTLGYVALNNDIMVMDDEDIVGTIEAEEGYRPTVRPWYTKAKAEGKTIWSEPYIDVNTKKLIVSCATPVLDSNRTLFGVVGLDVLLDTLKEDILTLDIGYDSYAFLVDRAGKVLVRPGMNEQDTRWDQSYDSENYTKTSNPAFNAIVRKMIQGISGIQSYDAEGSRKYLAYAPIPAIGASVAIVVAQNEVIQPAKNIQNLIIGAWVVVLIVSLLIGLLVGNNITKPINELTTIVDWVSQGKMDLDILPEERKDELGVLTQAFNRLIISLKLAMSR